MPFIEWDSSFSVGSLGLDNDHRQLVAILNRIYDAWEAQDPDAAKLDQLFGELLEYADGHFLREESKLSARGYDDLDNHHRAHERLRELVMAFRSRHLAGVQADVMTAEMAKFLKSWLIDHILGGDMKYRFLFKGE